MDKIAGIWVESVCFEGDKIFCRTIFQWTVKKSQRKDKRKDNEIRLETEKVLDYDQEVVKMAVSNIDLLNNIYREISNKLGVETAMEIYEMFKGQQISFPVRFLNPTKVQELILEEYDGTNIRALAQKYNYSDKTIRRIIKEHSED